MNPGKVSENVIKRSVLKNIHNDKTNGAGNNCAIFTGYIADDSSPECVVYAIIRACNNAAAAGYYVNQISISITMPVHMREIKLKAMMKAAGDYCADHGITIADGHTESVDGLIHPIISVAAVASSFPGKAATTKAAPWTPGKPAPGQAIVMTKWMAMSGGARIARAHREELLSRLPEFIVDGARELDQFMSVLAEAAVAVESDAICLNDCSDGGVFAALWQLADANGVGLSVNLKDIPVRQETIEVCEYYDINPYKLRSDGAWLIVTDKPEELVERLADADILGTVIGHITADNDRVIVAGEDRRFLEEPRQDEGLML